MKYNTNPRLSLALLCITATIVAASAALPAFATETVLGDRDGDGRVGEETAIKERVRAYVDRHGRDGELTGRQMLERSRWSYNEWLKSKRESKDGIDGESWVNIGPVNGAGRASCVAPHPSYEGVVLQGAASGGVWKTIDDGITWYPTTDGLSDLSVGAIEWALSSPDIVYLGTGEGDTLIAGGSGGIPGIGMLRSDDGGESWILPSDELDPVARFFFSLDVDPEDDESVFAATERGLLHTADGGVTWDVLLPSGGASYGYTEILRSESHPDLMYAGQWCEGSCPSGTKEVMRSTDGGATWLPTPGAGLPGAGGYVNRHALAMAQSDDQILYLAKTLDSGASGNTTAGIFRSDDGGETWTETAVSTTNQVKNYLGFQGWYDNTITVKPDDPNVVVAGGIWYVITNNGGESWRNRNPYQMGTSYLPHVDAHDLQWQGDKLWVACDGGTWFSEDDGITWTDRNDGVVTRQYYGIDIDPINRERVIGGTQDNGTDLRRDSGDNTIDSILGGDGFECAINPMLPDLLYATIYNTRVYRRSAGSSSFSNISPPFDANEENAPFITPLILHPTMPNVVFTGTDFLYRSNDGGTTWYRLPANPMTDVPGAFWFPGEIRAIAATSADPDRIMVSKGSLIFTTEDGGRLWKMASLGRTAYNVAISPFDANVAMAAMQASSSGDDGVMKSIDGGATWSLSGAGLPPFNVQVVRFDPLDQNVAYAGTDVGMYRTTDGGSSWSRLGNGLPAASVHDIKALPDGSMLRVGSYGRGFWELAIDRPQNTPPEITITTPSASTINIDAGSPLSLAATATDADGDDLTIDWYFATDYQILATSTGSAPYTAETNPIVESGGHYQVVARATDARGLQAVDYVTLLAGEPADYCETPRVIPGAGPFPASIATTNQFARIGANDPMVPCIDTSTSDPDSGREASVWFEFTPERTARYSISTCGSGADTVVSAWTGDPCGEYTAVEEGCSDNDEQVHCFGRSTDSYFELDLTAGETTRFMVGSWKSTEGQVHKGAITFNVDCLTCTDEPDDILIIIAASAHAGGLNDTTWSTDLDILNPGNEAVTARIAFLPAGTDNSDLPEVEITIPAGQISSFQDVVAGLLGQEGSGAIRILTPQTLIVASRTFNDSADGTFGQYIPGQLIQNAVPAGASARLIGLAGNEAFRTNIGFANASVEAASITVDLFAAGGSLLGSFEESLAPWGWLQLNRVFNTSGSGEISAATALITNTSDSAAVFVYASVVDAVTGDPTYVTETSPADTSSELWFAASAHADGIDTAVWRTDLNLANASDAAITATVDLLEKGADNSSPQTTDITVPAGESVAVGDVLNTNFAFTGTAALHVSVASGELFATSRTFNQAPTGTFGQFIPGVLRTAGVAQGASGVLPMVRHNEAFRTNFGFVNLGALNVGIHADFFDAAGELVASKDYFLPPFGFFQDGNALPEGLALAGGFAVVTTNTEGGEFLAYASIVDNGSDDPVFVPVSVITS